MGGTLRTRYYQTGSQMMLTDVKREPLCRFLGKDVPDVPFPSGNQAGMEFEMNMETALQDAVKNAVRNIGITLASLTIVGLAFWVPLF